MGVAVLKINGTTRTMRTGSLEIIDNINGSSAARATVYSSDGSYIPAQDDTVQIEDLSSNVLFGGFLEMPDQRYLVPAKSHLETTIDAKDWTALANRRLVKATTGAGLIARDVIDGLVSGYLATYGVTRDPSMPAGGALGALDYDYATVAQVINDIAKLAPGWVWYIDHNKVLTAFAPSLGTNPCPWSMTSTSTKVHGSDIRITRTKREYANRVFFVYNDGTSTPAVVQRDNTSEQTARGLYETVIRGNGPYTLSVAQAIADSYLTQLVVRPRTIEFQTLQSGARAGMTVSVNVPVRGVIGDFLITQVKTRDFDGQYLLYTVTAVEGGVLPADWKETFRQWGSGSSGIATTGGVTVVTSTIGRASYFLGGSGYAGESSAGPSVINAVGYIDVMIDQSAIGASTSVTAVVQCKTEAGGVGVTPQVYNVTTAAVAGTGSAVVGTSWTTVSFPVTIAAGQNNYRLRLTPDTADKLVFGLGYLEVGR